MKKIGFIGAYDKTDMIVYIGKILTVLKQKVLIVDSTLNQKAKYIVPVISETCGKVISLNAEKIGKISSSLGAGREKKEDKIDLSAGIVLNKKIGDKVDNGDVLLYLHTNKEDIIENAKKEVLSAYEIIN